MIFKIGELFKVLMSEKYKPFETEHFINLSFWSINVLLLILLFDLFSYNFIK